MVAETLTSRPLSGLPLISIGRSCSRCAASCPARGRSGGLGRCRALTTVIALLAAHVNRGPRTVLMLLAIPNRSNVWAIGVQHWVRQRTTPGQDLGGCKALSRTVRDVFDQCVIQRCQVRGQPSALITQNRLPSVSASTTKSAPSGYTQSTRLAPSDTSRSTSACCSSSLAAHRSRCIRSSSSK